MSTADVARDLDLLRRAVGDRRLTYLGFSYGSYLGNTYANLFPNASARWSSTACSTPGCGRAGGRSSRDRVATRRMFEEFLRLCDAGRRQCAFCAAGRLPARWAAPRRLRAAGARSTVTRPTATTFLSPTPSVRCTRPRSGAAPGYAAFLDLVADAALGDQARRGAGRRARPARPAAARARPTTRTARRLLREPVRRHASTRARFRAFRARVAVHDGSESRLGPYWWWGNTCVCQLADRARPVRRPVGDPHLRAGARRGQLLRRGHRLPRARWGPLRC